MRLLPSRLFLSFLGFSVVFAGATPTAAAAGAPPASASDHARIVAHWTPERMAAAIPRDLVIDERGQGYLRKPDGSLEPYGHTIVAAALPVPMAKPTGDKTPPSITNLDPANGATIAATSYTFKATVKDASGVRSVSFKVGKSGAARQSFSAALTSNDVWAVSLQGLTDGDWVWNVVAKDKAGNTATSPDAAFTIATSGGGGGGSNLVTNAEWIGGGTVQTAVGRLYFEMPANAQRAKWNGYVCSGTVVTDATSGRSVIQTAAHCVYDDANKAFARNVMFIPDQAATKGTGTDLNCGNDPLGCWTPTFGVVDVNWTSRTFPDNVKWDYAYYVAYDGAHQVGYADKGGVLDAAAGSLAISFNVPAFDVANSDTDYTDAFGYSYSEDPNLMYCAEDLHQLDDADWWLGSCGLSGGSSGGPWVQPLKNGAGPLISVNSWGYTNQPGMAGPKLWGTTAQSVFACATQKSLSGTPADGDEGLIYPDGCK
ncbi:MAG TPA: Ig-like domain-containing protein [Steroidobacteraceae bacterium]